MPTSVEEKNATLASHVARYEKKLLDAQQAIAHLPGDDFYTGLLGIIHRPGWTTIAEGLFFEALVDNIQAHTQHLAELHTRLRAASEAVGEQRTQK